MHALTRTPLPARGARILALATLVGIAYADPFTAAAAAAAPGLGIPAVGSPAVGSPAGAQTAGSTSGALVAPELDGPRRPPTFGALGVRALAKPDPATGAATASTTAGAAASEGSTTAYAAAGAALGLVPSAAAVYSAVRSTFGITTIGGLRPGDWGDHGTGHAVDVMITSSAQGDAVAAYALANAGRFGIKYVIWQQRIWLPSTGVWRLMEDRGSPTQNHMDHVHISVN